MEWLLATHENGFHARHIITVNRDWKLNLEEVQYGYFILHPLYN